MFLFLDTGTQILYFTTILLQIQDVPEDSDIVAIEKSEAETKSEDLEESVIDKTDLKSKTDVSYVIMSVYSEYFMK